jgi:methylated-DNA-[protein]-cysteine S-methyltransferase
MLTGTDTLLYNTIDSPIGELLLLGDGWALHGLYMQEGRHPIEIAPSWEREPAAFTDVSEQLSEYFAGRRTSFDVPLAMDGAPFQRRAWRALQDIPYGETITYGEQARRIGQPSAARAVGMANGRNPIAVIVPCHRVIGANGTLTGYGGGIERKRLLLDLEARAGARQLSMAGDSVSAPNSEGSRAEPRIRSSGEPLGSSRPWRVPK